MLEIPTKPPIYGLYTQIFPFEPSTPNRRFWLRLRTAAVAAFAPVNFTTQEIRPLDLRTLDTLGRKRP